MKKSMRRVLYASHPDGWVTPDCFSFDEAPVPDVADGDVLLRTVYVSMDPYMRGLMATGAHSYAEMFKIGAPLNGRVIAEVVESRHPDFRAGQFVFGMQDWSEYSVARQGAGLRIVDEKAAHLGHYLGTLGFPGLTAYVGMVKIGQPKAGETVYVSAASGAVGQVAGQLARISGARVVGSAGSDAKVDFVRDECRFDAAFNYNNVSSVGDALKEHCPDGIDVNFENVGGENLQAVINNANIEARLVICGMISQYNTKAPFGVTNLNEMVSKRMMMKGYVVRDHAELLPEYLDRMSSWIREGQVQVKQNISQGLDSVPDAFIGMLKGQNFGKQIVQFGVDPFSSN